MRLAPRLDRVLVNRLRGVGHDERHVELDDVAEPVAHAARAERVVEREQSRLRHLVLYRAAAALEALAEAVDNCRRGACLERRGLGKLNRKGGAATLGVGRLNRVREPGAQIAVDLHAVDNYLQHRAILERRRIDLVERERLPVDVETPESFASQRGQRLGHRVHQPRQILLAGVVVGAALVLLLILGNGIVLVAALRALPIRQGRRRHDRHVESDKESSARGTHPELSGDDLGRFAHDLAAAIPAHGAAHAREQQPEVVVDFRRGADRRSGVADAVLLANRNRRADAFDRVDVGLLHPLEELAGVGRQRLNIPALALRINRVEGERRLARPADTRHHHQGPLRDGQIDVLEVVGTGAADDDVVPGLSSRWHLQCALLAKP